MIWAPPRRAASRFQVLNFLFNPLILANYVAVGEGHTDQVYLAVRHDPWDIQDHHIDLVYKATSGGAGLSIPVEVSSMMRRHSGFDLIPERPVRIPVSRGARLNGRIFCISA